MVGHLALNQEAEVRVLAPEPERHEMAEHPRDRARKAGRKAHALTSEKAKEILEDGEVGGHALTAKQRKFFGFVAGGGKPTRQ